mmetsp:Transcript_26592/g.87164  ORF Transcript_26592/g.87164 Transcript_26592/m.87164 type:complete len:506 (-) Transcript_26592:58-1575(-)
MMLARPRSAASALRRDRPAALRRRPAPTACSAGGGGSRDDGDETRAAVGAASVARRAFAGAAALVVSCAALALPPDVALATAAGTASYSRPGKPPKFALTPEEAKTVDIFAQNTPSVVYITNLAYRRDVFTLDPIEAAQGAGSGFIWDKEGHIVTNYHVIKGAADLRVTLGGVTLGEDRTFKASVVGYDEDKDIAVLKMDPEAMVGMDLRPILPSESDQLMVGQKVYAIGNPFGLDHTLTVGVISGLSREIASGNTGRPIDGIIQTDAAINPGNSGGPLLNSSGQFIGVNTAIYSASGTSSGVGFALPSNMVRGIVDQIITYGRVTRPVLGISFAPDPFVQELGLGGVLVLDARPYGPAAKAGMRSTTRDEEGRLILGDVITSIDGRRVNNSTDLFRVLDKCSVGQTVSVQILRGDGQKKELEIQLEDLNQTPRFAIMDPNMFQFVLPPGYGGGPEGGGVPGGPPGPEGGGGGRGGGGGGGGTLPPAYGDAQPNASPGYGVPPLP